MDATIENPVDITADIRNALRTGLACLATAVIVFNTLAFGGTPPWALQITRFSVLAGLVLVIPLVLTDRDYFGGILTHAAVPLGFVGVFAVFGWLQHLAGPNAVLSGPFPGSVNRHATLESAEALLYYAAFFLVCAEGCRHRRPVERIASFLALFALAVTLFGLVQRMSGTKNIYWRLDAGTPSFFGPFVYENSYGAFLALLLPLVLAMSAYRFFRGESFKMPRTFRDAAKTVVEATDSGSLLFLITAALTLAAAVYSQARAATFILLGTGASFAAAAVMLTRSRRLIAIFAALAGGAVFVVIRLDVSQIAANFMPALLAQEFAARIRLMHDAIRMFFDRPFFGWGLGTFYAVVPKYMSDSMEHFAVYHANNDYTELLAETGLFGAALLGGAFAAYTAPALFGVLARRSRWARVMGIQALVALFTLAMTSVFDSHVRLPAIAYLMILQLALLGKAASPSRTENDTTAPAHPGGSMKPRIVLSLAMLLAAAYLLRSAMDRQAILTCSATPLSTSRLLACLERQPANPGLWYRLAAAYVEKSRSYRRERARDCRRKAIAAMEQAVALSPTDFHYRFLLGQFLYRNGDDAGARSALETARTWAPSNRRVAIFLMSTYLDERTRVVSSRKKELVLEKARALFRELQALRTPPIDADFQNWMIRYDEETLSRFRQSPNPPGGAA